MNKIDTLIRRRAEERRRIAESRVSRILLGAQRRGVDISVVGSLARGCFRLHSDIDLLVHGETDPARRAMIEHLVADHLRGTDIPYDLIFASDLSPDRVQELLNDRVQAPGICEVVAENRAHSEGTAADRDLSVRARR